MTAITSNATADCERLRAPASLPLVDIDRLGADLDEAMTVAETATLVRTTPATIGRWIAKGVPGVDGRIYRLSALRIGRRKFIRRRDLQAFLQGLQAS